MFCKTYIRFFCFFSRYTLKFYGEHPNKSYDYGRIINKHHKGRLMNLIETSGGKHLKLYEKEENFNINKVKNIDKKNNNDNENEQDNDVNSNDVDNNNNNSNNDDDGDDDKDRYIPPTIIDQVSLNSLLMKQPFSIIQSNQYDAINGPILPIIKVKNELEVVKLINNIDTSPSCFYLFTNKKNTHQILKKKKNNNNNKIQSFISKIMSFFKSNINNDDNEEKSEENTSRQLNFDNNNDDVASKNSDENSDANDSTNSIYDLLSSYKIHAGSVVINDTFVQILNYHMPFSGGGSGGGGGGEEGGAGGGAGGGGGGSYGSFRDEDGFKCFTRERGIVYKHYKYDLFKIWFPFINIKYPPNNKVPCSFYHFKYSILSVSSSFIVSKYLNTFLFK